MYQGGTLLDAATSQTDVHNEPPQGAAGGNPQGDLGGAQMVVPMYEGGTQLDYPTPIGGAPEFWGGDNTHHFAGHAGSADDWFF
jgi:hypothetical protein